MKGEFIMMCVQGEMYDFFDIFNQCDGDPATKQRDNAFADEKEIF